MDVEPPQSLRDLDLNALIGLPVDRAREIVESAGGVLRAVAPGAMVTLEHRADRVTVLVIDGEVLENRGLG